MKYPTQEEKNQAMENMECWKTIEEEFRKKYGAFEICEKISKPEQEKILKFFKPYFQEQMHEKAVEELEAVDNSKQ